MNLEMEGSNECAGKKGVTVGAGAISGVEEREPRCGGRSRALSAGASEGALLPSPLIRCLFQYLSVSLQGDQHTELRSLAAAKPSTSPQPFNFDSLPNIGASLTCSRAMATLPEPLKEFLSSYPHPCFALSASPLHGALTTRQTSGFQTASREPAQPTSDSRGSRSAVSSARKGSVHSGNSSGRQRPHNAEEILSTAFGNEVPSLASGAPPPTHASLLEGGSQQAHHPSRTVEGAVAAMYEQRAARELEDAVERARAADSNEGKKLEREGAEQAVREAVEDKWSGAGRNMEVGAGGDRGREGMGAGLANLLTPVWTNDRFGDLVKQAEVKEGEAEGPEITLMSLMTRQDVQKVLALLVQVTSPSEASSSSSRSDNTITLQLTFPPHSANYRSSRRKQRSSVPTRSSSNNPNPNLKGNAYNTTSAASVSSGSQASSGSSSAVEIEADYNFQLVATWMEQEDLVVVTSIATNIFPGASSSWHGLKRISTSAKPRSQPIGPLSAPVPSRPTLSHTQPGPTAVGPMPSPPTPIHRPSSSPSPTRALEPIDETTASSASSESGGKSFPPRPRLQHRESDTSGTSASSTATITAQSSTSNSTARTPTASRPGTRASSSLVVNQPDGTSTYFPDGQPISSSSIAANAPASSPAAGPLPTDQVPRPLGSYTGKPYFDEGRSSADVEAARAAALMLLGNSGTKLSDPTKEYLMEKRKKRKAKREKERRERESVVALGRAGGALEGVTESGDGGRAGEERELTHEEEKVQGRREREARKWREEMEAREDAEDADEEADEERQLQMLAEEEAERSELDEKMDRELDLLRSSSRGASGDEGGIEGDMPTGSARNVHSSDSDQVDVSLSPAGSSAEPPSPLSVANLRLRTLGDDDTAACIDSFLEIINRTPVGRLIAIHPWEKTNLGPLKTWSAELRSMVRCSRYLIRPLSLTLNFARRSCSVSLPPFARLFGGARTRCSSTTTSMDGYSRRSTPVCSACRALWDGPSCGTPWVLSLPASCKERPSPTSISEF